MIKEFYFGERLEWTINLPPGRTLELIASQNSGNLFERMLTPGIGVRLSKNKFVLSKMNIGNIRFSSNGFAHVLAGTVEEISTGSKISAQFRLQIPSMIIFSIWGVAAVAVLLTSLVLVLFRIRLRWE